MASKVVARETVEVEHVEYKAREPLRAFAEMQKRVNDGWEPVSLVVVYKRENLANVLGKPRRRAR